MMVQSTHRRVVYSSQEKERKKINYFVQRRQECQNCPNSFHQHYLHYIRFFPSFLCCTRIMLQESWHAECCVRKRRDKSSCYSMLYALLHCSHYIIAFSSLSLHSVHFSHSRKLSRLFDYAAKIFY